MGIIIAEEIHIETSQCGINSLYLCLRHLAINVKLDQIYSDMERDDRNEVNLYQLAVYADQYGIPVKRIKHPTLHVINTYLTNNACAIVQYKYPDNRPHIAALLQAQEKQLLFCDYPRKKFVISEEDLADVLEHSRGMLILSQKPFSKSVFCLLSHSKILWCCIITIAVGFMIVKIWQFLTTKAAPR